MPVQSASRLRAQLRKAILNIGGVIESGSAFGDEDGFWVNGKQIAHWDSDAQIQIRLTRARIREHRQRFECDPRITFRSKTSEALHVSFASTRDLPFVVELAELAAEAYRASPGTTPKPPPTGADLARRRRFH